MTLADRDIGPIVFFGTPEFAVPPLEALVAARLAPVLVVSQPARPAGRGGRLTEPPVARWARRHALEVAQPARVAAPEFVERLRRRAPAVAVVVAFGQIFPPALLRLPPLGCVNLHASLLPRHRGAAPMQAAIVAGDERTGVTTMLMDEGLDTGAILARREVEIGRRETGGELAARLARIGGALVVETLRALAAGESEPAAQDESLATYAPRLRREDGRIDWRRPAAELERLVRAYAPWPGTFAILRDEPLKVIVADLGEASAPTGGAPGELVAILGGRLEVACGDGRALSLARVQRPGRRPVAGAELAGSLGLVVGERFD